MNTLGLLSDASSRRRGDPPESRQRRRRSRWNGRSMRIDALGNTVRRHRGRVPDPLTSLLHEFERGGRAGRGALATACEHEKLQREHNGNGTGEGNSRTGHAYTFGPRKCGDCSPFSSFGWGLFPKQTPGRAKTDLNRACETRFRQVWRSAFDECGQRTTVWANP